MNALNAILAPKTATKTAAKKKATAANKETRATAAITALLAGTCEVYRWSKKDGKASKVMKKANPSETLDLLVKAIKNGAELGRIVTEVPGLAKRFPWNDAADAVREAVPADLFEAVARCLGIVEKDADASTAPAAAPRKTRKSRKAS